MIPGSNLLKMAFTLIATECVIYHASAGRALNAVGQDISKYLNPRRIKCSFQPVQKNLYQSLGLDLQKSYFNMYVPRDIIDIRRDLSSDQITFKNQLFQCLSCTEWIGIDGWVAVLCVDVTTQIPNDKPIFGFDILPRISMYINYFYSNFSVGADN